MHVCMCVCVCLSSACVCVFELSTCVFVFMRVLVRGVVRVQVSPSVNPVHFRRT